MQKRTARDASLHVGSPSLASEESVHPSINILGEEVSRDFRISPPCVVVMIPCLNEKRTVTSVVRRIPRKMPGIRDVKVLVIDDGSRDETALAAVRAGADALVRHKTNLGLGRTFKDGLDASLRLGADIIVNIDADGQYDPAEIPRLLAPILHGRADIVLGNRQVERLSHMRWSRRWGNQIASWVTRRVSGLRVRDAQTGFRALTRAAAVRLTLNGSYTYTQEMIILAAYRGLVVEEVPISFRRRTDGSSRLITSAWRYALRSGTIILRAYRDHNPMRAFTLIGTATLAIGILFGLRVLFHYLATGQVFPFLPSTIVSIVLFIAGIQIVIFGFLADMLKRQREVQEEVLFSLRNQALEPFGRHR